jgi:hypothetical protein
VSGVRSKPAHASRLKVLTLAAASAFVLLAAFEAGAQELVDATDPEKLVAVIQELGYRALLDVDNIGDPVIKSSVGGTDFSILFFGCDEQNHDQCKLLLFKVGYDLDEGTTVDNVNEWNESRVVGRAYLDDEMDPWLEMAVNMDGGVSRRNFEDTFDWWEVSIEDFESHIDF